MTVDRAIDSTEFDSKLTTVADAIRTAGGTTEPMSFPSGMVEAISALKSGSEAGGVSYPEQLLLLHRLYKQLHIILANNQPALLFGVVCRPVKIKRTEYIRLSVMKSGNIVAPIFRQLLKVISHLQFLVLGRIAL